VENGNDTNSSKLFILKLNKIKKSSFNLKRFSKLKCSLYVWAPTKLLISYNSSSKILKRPETGKIFIKKLNI